MEALGAADSTEMSNERKAAILLHTIGSEVQDIYNTLEVPETTKKDWKNLFDYLEHHFKPKENETINRHQFHTRKQKESESVDMFITDLKKLSQNCNFGELRDSLLRDRIVCGILDKKVRDRLLREAKLDLTQCVNICNAAELAEAQSKQLSEETNVSMVRKNAGNLNRKQQNNTKIPKLEADTNKQSKCRKCGLFHWKNCPAYGKICRNCRKYNHFDKMCRYKKTNLIEECEVEEEGAETDLFVGVIETNTKQVNSVKEWVQKIKIKGSEIECKLDTGVEVNILNMKTVKSLNAKVRTSKI
ncbi:hypothetical protein QE152_g39063 [Popillia japonica]|uniref:Retrotransposon gag domain-containing protein n=1 Tax=Popillia japonica TaxID=7064 RepID=A0AAW1HUV3_POPJA